MAHSVIRMAPTVKAPVEVSRILGFKKNDGRTL